MLKFGHLITAALLLPLASVSGQSLTAKGTRVLGVSTQNNYYATSKSSSFLTLSAIPSAGKFFADNWAFGLTLPISYTTQKDKLGEGKSHNFTVGLSPWLRYYLPSESRHRIFIESQAGVALNRYNYKRAVYSPISGNTDYDSYRNSSTSYFAGIGPGYSYFITPNVGLEMAVLYQRSGIFDGAAGNTGALAFNVGLRAYVGQ